MYTYEYKGLVSSYTQAVVQPPSQKGIEPVTLGFEKQAILIFDHSANGTEMVSGHRLRSHVTLYQTDCVVE